MDTPAAFDALTELLEQIDAGLVEASSVQRAYLAGALDALTGALKLDLKAKA